MSTTLKKNYTYSSSDDPNPDRDYAFWQPFGVGIIWSNPHVSDDVMMGHASIRSSDEILLKIAERFGWERLLFIFNEAIKPQHDLAKPSHIPFLKGRMERLYNHAHPSSPISL